MSKVIHVRVPDYFYSSLVEAAKDEGRAIGAMGARLMAAGFQSSKHVTAEHGVVVGRGVDPAARTSKQKEK